MAIGCALRDQTPRTVTPDAHLDAAILLGVDNWVLWTFQHRRAIVNALKK